MVSVSRVLFELRSIVNKSVQQSDHLSITRAPQTSLFSPVWQKRVGYGSSPQSPMKDQSADLSRCVGIGMLHGIT